MKCPKCKRPMIQLFSSWVCDHCDPPDGKKPTTPNKEPETEDDCILSGDDQWNGWEYADDRYIAIIDPNKEYLLRASME